MKLKKQINQIYGKHTGISLSVIESNMERDKFMSPAEAKEFGLIDKILEHPPKHENHGSSKEEKKEEKLWVYWAVYFYNYSCTHHKCLQKGIHLFRDGLIVLFFTLLLIFCLILLFFRFFSNNAQIFTVKWRTNWILFKIGFGGYYIVHLCFSLEIQNL